VLHHQRKYVTQNIRHRVQDARNITVTGACPVIPARTGLRLIRLGHAGTLLSRGQVPLTPASLCYRTPSRSRSRRAGRRSSAAGRSDRADSLPPRGNMGSARVQPGRGRARAARAHRAGDVTTRPGAGRRAVRCEPGERSRRRSRRGRRDRHGTRRRACRMSRRSRVGALAAGRKDVDVCAVRPEGSAARAVRP
jgi:hypothetical protein